MSARRYVVTGAASGIGATARTLLEAAGHEVIGVDRRDTEIAVDLSTAEGRRSMVEQVEARVDGLEGVLAIAGLSGQSGNAELIIRVDYFGAVATLEGLRPLLTRGSSPRAATVASIALLREPTDAIVNACLAGDEAGAVDQRGEDSHAAYTSSKLALGRWVRREAPSKEWAGAGIPLNAVGPGIINTPMAAYLIDTPEARAATAQNFHQPLGTNGEPEHVASLLAWLTSADNGFVTGQIIFADGGYEAATRGPAWP
jgi:NAD(P)-dependent dehydrogenase (short-subunit alcohol dehydrogenase family)